MAFRFETASGLRLYACDARFRMGETSSIRFLDPFNLGDLKAVEILFETKALVKYCRLNNSYLHLCFHRCKIIPQSLFIHEVDAGNIADTYSYTVTKSNAYEILCCPWKLL
jgi:hypothetical protein